MRGTSTSTLRGELALHRRAAGQDDHGPVAVLLEQQAQDLEALQPRQIPVEQHQLGLKALLQGSEAGFAVGEGVHLEAVIAELRRHRFAIEVVVIDQRDRRRRAGRQARRRPRIRNQTHVPPPSPRSREASRKMGTRRAKNQAVVLPFVEDSGGLGE